MIATYYCTTHTILPLQCITIIYYTADVHKLLAQYQCYCTYNSKGDDYLAQICQIALLIDSPWPLAIRRQCTYCLYSNQIRWPDPTILTLDIDNTVVA